MRRFLLVLIILLISILFVKGLEYNIPVSVTVLPIYELSIDIDILNERIFVGENLRVFIELEKTDLSSVSEEIAVDLNYEIIKGKKLVEKGFLKTISIVNEQTEIIKVQPSSDLRGGYILKITASNPQAFLSKDSDRFFVRSNKRPFFTFFRYVIWVWEV